MQSVARFVARRYFFSGLVIADGTICDDCEKMVRGQFNIEEYYGRENWKISTSDPLKAMTVEELKDMINEKKAEQTQVVEEIGGDYAAIAKVEKTFGIAPKATDVGLKRAKALKNRIVATSYIMSGEFSRGDAVTVSFDGADMTTTILDVIECSSSSTFETALNATFGKHKAKEGVSAWIILDVMGGVGKGALIKKWNFGKLYNEKSCGTCIY